MASSVIGALRAVLGLDTAQFESGADRAKAKAGGLKAALMSTAASLTPLAVATGLATIAVQAFAAGMRLAAEAATFADDIAAQSYKLGVSAEYLQAFNFAAGESDVPVDKAADALMGLSAAIGALQSGIGDGKIRKAMEALGISQDQIDSFKSVEDALPVIADKIAGLGTVTEQLQFAKKFGIEALLPMLKQGSVGIEAMMQKFRDLGMSIDNDVIDRLAGMSREMEIADQRSKMAGLSFGATFTPALVAMKNATADAVSWLSKLIDRFNAVENRSLDTLRDQRFEAHNAMLAVRGWAAGPNRDEALAAANRRIADLDREINRRFDARQNRAQAKPTFAEPNGDEPRSPPSSGGGVSSKEDDWADLFGQVQADAARVQADEFARRFKESIIDPATLQEPIADSVLAGVVQGMSDARQAFSDQIYNATRGGLDALRYGGLKGFTNFLADSFANAMNDRLAKSISGLIEGQSTGGTLMSFFKSLVGFDTGGSFRVGGVGGTDSQLRMLRLSPGENVSINRGNDAGGARILEVRIAAGPTFKAEVSETAAGVVGAAAGPTAELGSRHAQAAVSSQSRYRIAR